MDIHISVRNLVEFILRSGDIDNRKAVAPENAMQEGSRIHRMIQRRMGSDYHAEVSLQYLYETENYRILIDGRADGIIDATESNGNMVTIDEIKGTLRKHSRFIWHRRAAMLIFMRSSRNFRQSGSGLPIVIWKQRS